jgi:dienelactone hydrolase
MPSSGSVVRELASGAEARFTNDPSAAAVVLVNGGQSAEVPGTWSATIEWLVRRLAPRFPGLRFAEVRYRVKSWRRLELCVEDARAAIAAATDEGSRRIALVGFSMGGAVAVSAAADPAVRAVIGLAPWLPVEVPLDPLAGKRLSIVHGALDRPLPGIPGVTAASSRRAFERARAAGVADSAYRVLRGAGHGTALRTPLGLAPLPRARIWAELVAAELATFELPRT